MSASPMNVDSENLEELIQLFRDEKITTSAISGDKESRAELLKAAKKLTAALEAPDDKLNYAQFYPHVFMCTRVAVDLNVFQILANREGQYSSKELATETGAEEQLLVRLMRGLTYAGFATEVENQIYQANSTTHYLTAPSVQAGIRHWYDAGLKSLYAMPEYFKINKYSSPVDAYTGPLQYAFNTKLDSYAYWKTMPEFAENFNTFMSGKFNSEEQSQSWMDYCQIQKELIDGYDGNLGDAMFVDVGGSFGHVVQDFKRRYPSAPGRFIVQDLPDVIDDIKQLDADIERQKYSFFTPQPVVGARVYYFANVLHNWSNADCLKILSNVVPAMVKNYSVLLLNEGIMPGKDCSLSMIGRDLGMMALHSAVERSEQQWKALLEQVGLRVVKFWYSGLGEGVVEAVLV